MSIGIAHHRKVTDDTANVHRWLNQNILFARQLSNSINFFATVALKPEVIEPGLNFVLYNNQNEDRIFSRRCIGTKPDIVTAFEPAITHDRKTAERGVEVD